MVGLVTGTRAEYGLLRGLMREIACSHDLELRLVATGMHLSPEFGLTYRQIEEEGFPISEKVEMLLSSDTASGTAKSTGLGVIGFTDCLARLNPDVLVLLGDRFETFAAGVAAHILGIPIAHIHGGEVTEGAIDDALRHSLTKMATLHFVAAEAFRRRIIQMGEEPARVFNVGAPGLDGILEKPFLSREELESFVGISLPMPFFLVTFHPETLGGLGPGQSIQALLDALEAFPEATVLFTLGNADSGGREIKERIRRYADSRPDRVQAVQSMGQQRYQSALRLADVVIGNSSSGIIEAPSFGVSVVNIGDRQKGRPRAESVIDSPAERGAIIQAISRALSPEFREIARSCRNPYRSGHAARSMREILASYPFDRGSGKKFYDLPDAGGEANAHEPME